MTLVEVLGALTVLGILASSGTLGLMTLMRTSTQADLQSRHRRVAQRVR